MSNYSVTRPSYISPAQPGEPGIHRFIQLVLAVISGLALFVLLLGLFVIAYSATNSGKIYPGVSVGGIDLSGLTPEAGAALLSQQLDYVQRGQIVLKDGEHIWTARPEELGLYLNSLGSVQEAYNLGRNNLLVTNMLLQYQAWHTGVDLSPQYVLDESAELAYIASIEAQVNRPVIEATITVNGVDVAVHSGQVGRSLDVDMLMQSLRQQFQSQTDGIIPLVIKETPPVILDASAQAEIARKILSAPLVLKVPQAEQGDPGPWTFDVPTLAKMLVIDRVETPAGSQYQVGLNDENLRPFLQGLAPNLERQTQNARFTFNDNSRQLELLQPGVIGRNLDVDETLKAINQKLVAGEHNLDLVMGYTQPQVGDQANAEKLGIRELVSQQVSYFRGSTDARVQNIKTAAGRFHGVLVAPGEVFSMANILGDVSLDTGYAEALIIFGDRTIKGVGGGVCQVSSTLFRTAFFAGLKIVARYPHAYRVGYYEQTANGHNADLAGMDATVFVPLVDFKFQNDTPNWLLMETYVNTANSSLTWKFYSTSDGRKVDWNTTGLQNVTDPPPPIYEENPDLSKGEIVQTDYEVQGADVTITRSVTRNGSTLYDDTFTTHYLPWRAVFEYGPGTKDIPTPEPGATP